MSTNNWKMQDGSNSMKLFMNENFTGLECSVPIAWSPLIPPNNPILDPFENFQLNQKYQKISERLRTDIKPQWTTLATWYRRIEHWHHFSPKLTYQLQIHSCHFEQIKITLMTWNCLTLLKKWRSAIWLKILLLLFEDLLEVESICPLRMKNAH